MGDLQKLLLADGVAISLRVKASVGFGAYVASPDEKNCLVLRREGNIAERFVIGMMLPTASSAGSRVMALAASS